MRILIAFLLILTVGSAMALDNGSATKRDIPQQSGLDAARAKNPLNQLLRDLESKELRGEIERRDAVRIYGEAYKKAPRAVREEHDRLFDQMLRDMEAQDAMTGPGSQSPQQPNIPADLKDAW